LHPKIGLRLAHGAIITGILAGILGYCIGYLPSLFLPLSSFSFIPPHYQLAFLDYFQNYWYLLILIKPPFFLMNFSMLTVLCGWNHINFFWFCTTLAITKCRLYLFYFFLKPEANKPITKDRAYQALKWFGVFFTMMCMAGFCLMRYVILK
jgi:membrane protein YqaA with SNARE-associated domain